jgi:hypothetical protein
MQHTHTSTPERQQRLTASLCDTVWQGLRRAAQFNCKIRQFMHDAESARNLKSLSAYVRRGTLILEMHTLFYVQDIYAVCVCLQAAFVAQRVTRSIDAAAIKKATALNSP